MAVAAASVMVAVDNDDPRVPIVLIFVSYSIFLYPIVFFLLTLFPSTVPDCHTQPHMSADLRPQELPPRSQ